MWNPVLSKCVEWIKIQVQFSLLSMLFNYLYSHCHPAYEMLSLGFCVFNSLYFDWVGFGSCGSWPGQFSRPSGWPIWMPRGPFLERRTHHHLVCRRHWGKETACISESPSHSSNLLHLGVMHVFHFRSLSLYQILAWPHLEFTPAIDYSSLVWCMHALWYWPCIQQGPDIVRHWNWHCFSTYPQAAPMLGMLRHMLKTRQQHFARGEEQELADFPKVYFIWSTRSAAEMELLDEELLTEASR